MKNLLYLFVVISLIGCEKDKIPMGIETRVYGRFTDYYDTPVTNAKVKIGEYIFRPNSVNGGMDEFQRWIASGNTNANGEYDFKFTSSGLGTSYKLELENSPFITEQAYWTLLDPVDIVNIGASFHFSTMQLALLYPCDVTIHPNNLTVFPIGISHETTFFDNVLEITSNNTMVKRIYIIKYNNQTLVFFRKKPDGVNQKATFTFPASNVDVQTTQNITLNETDFVDF